MRDLQCEEGAPKPGFWFRWMLYLLKATGTAFFLLIIWLSIGLEWRVSPNHIWIDKDRHFLAFYALSLLALVTITKMTTPLKFNSLRAKGVCESCMISIHEVIQDSAMDAFASMG